MSDYLVTHALEHVWCAPDQDNQYIVRPKCITPKNGVVNSYSFLWTTIALPKVGVRYSLYQVGQIHPALLNLVLKEGQWVLISDVVDQGSAICDLYETTGIHFPTTQTWYTITKERALLIAVQRNPKIAVDYDKIQMYLRVYDNAYFASQRVLPLWIT